MHTVIFLAFLIQFLGIVLHASAENCVNHQDMVVSGCVCAAGFRVDSYTSCDQGHCSPTPDWANCHVCPAGTYSAAGDAACAPCAAGTRSAAGAASCTAGVLNKTASDDAAVETILARIDALIADNDVDAAVKKALDSLDVHTYVASHAPGLYALIVIGFVGAVLNSVAIFVLFLWVRSMKTAVTQIDAGSGAV